MLKIGFIQAVGNDSRSYGVPLSFGYLVSVLAQSGEQFEYQVTTEPYDLIDWAPDAIGVGSVTSCFGQAEEYLNLFRHKLPNARIVVGGHHIGALPHRLPKAADVGVIGEGEQTFLELMRTLQGKGAWQPAELRAIPGICFHEPGGGVAITPDREPCRDLDRLPFPVRAINPSDPHEAIIFTSRGCPFHCAYCSTRRHWETYRRFSAEYVVAELQSIVQAFPDVTSIRILDDLYVADRVRLREMVRLIRDAGLHQRLRFHGFVRSNLVDDELCELLTAMNVDAIRFGAESGSDAVLQRMDRGGKCSVATHQQAIDLAERWGLKCTASFMLGYPGETREDLEATFEFIRRNQQKLQIEGFYLAVPLPGTELWKWAQRRGLVGEDMDWKRLNLSFGNPDFDWNDFLYLNDDAIPRAEFVSMVRESGLIPAESEQRIIKEQSDQALQRVRSVLSELSASGVRRVALYGAGEHTRRLRNHLPLLRPSIVAILDDAPPRTRHIGPLPIHHPRDLPALNLDAVIISSDVWENEIWSRRSSIERHGVAVRRLYGKEAAVIPLSG